jgi:hypothetical protein
VEAITMRNCGWGFLAIVLALATPTRAQPPFDVESLLITKQVVDVTVRSGVTVRYLSGFSNVVPPTQAVILFAGGNGRLAMTGAGAITTPLQHNFLVRSRWIFAHRGLHVAVVDTPGATEIDGDDRLSAQYSGDIGKVIRDVRTRSGGLPVWLVGTSSGTISAASVAARRPLIDLPSPRLNFDRPDGVVLTSTQTFVTGGCQRTVFNASLANINVPAFVVAHLHDSCPCSPSKDAPAVIAALASSPARNWQQFLGGLPPISTGLCEAYRAHGFYGIEGVVVTAIANWIKSHSTVRAPRPGIVLRTDGAQRR